MEMDYFEEMLKEQNEMKKELEKLSNYEKFEYMLKKNRISISFVQRVFNYSYPKAVKIIDQLIECKAIEKQENGYIFLSQNKFLEFARNNSKEDKKIKDTNYIIY